MLVAKINRSTAGASRRVLLLYVQSFSEETSHVICAKPLLCYLVLSNIMSVGELHSFRLRVADLMKLDNNIIILILFFFFFLHIQDIFVRTFRLRVTTTIRQCTGFRDSPY